MANGLAARTETGIALTALVDRASRTLAGAINAAEVLEAHDIASFAYDDAQRLARIAKKKGAHDEVIGAVYRAQADALEIESKAKRRLADEYDAVQPSGASLGGRPKTVPEGNGFTAERAGLSRKLIHDARKIRNAEEVDPGIVRRTLDEALAGGEEPTKAKVKRAVRSIAPRQVAPITLKPSPGLGREAICLKVKEAITALSGLPPAAQVVSYFSGTDLAVLISERHATAAAWLAEFSSEWKDD